MRKLLPILLLAFVASACADVLTAGAAVVNGVRISQARLETEVDAQLRNPQLGGQDPGDEGRLEIARQVLLSLIQQEVLRQEAEARGLKVTAAEIDAQIAEIKTQFSGDADFAARLKEFGLTPLTLRDRIGERLLVDKLSQQLAGPLDPAALRAVYEQEKQRFRQIRVKHILFAVDQRTSDAAAKKQANAVLAQLKAGGDFAALAKRHSDDPSSKDLGGALPGFTSVGTLDPTFGGAAFNAKIGQVTGPVRSQFGYHVIVTLAKRTQPFAEVQDELRRQFTQQQGQVKLDEFMRATLAVAKVVVNPRYGDWDPKATAIVAHKFFEPPDTAEDQDQPGGFQPQFPIPDRGGAPPPDAGSSG